MIGVLTYASVAILLGWVVYALTGLFATAKVALIAGGVIGALSVILFRDTIVVRGFVAVLGPIGIMLPLLALRHAAAGAGVAIPSFGTVELLLFLLGYMVFLATAMGVIPVDLYRFGYAPVSVAIMVLALCGYGALTGNVFIPLVAVLGQALWVMGWGSSNWFDHVTHALLVPILFVVLTLRLF
ncbi:hypothetical protein [uncultured Roseovarius sp.]|uniref:hypothetical protein n=1 Tax=uncultured Roseovarius sp. TaxID=293344 RepID=UPI002638837C|nr:hypothetical protein [uncultured Roseovarius sp.]